METRADDDEAPTDPAARKHTHHDYTEQDFEGKVLYYTGFYPQLCMLFIMNRIYR